VQAPPATELHGCGGCGTQRAIATSITWARFPCRNRTRRCCSAATAAPALRRAGRLAQGWIGSSRHDLTEIGTYVETVRDGARAAGRDPQALRIVVRYLVDLVDLVDGDLGGRRLPLHGTREQVTSTGRPH